MKTRELEISARRIVVGIILFLAGAISTQAGTIDIGTVGDLQNIQTDLSGNYILTAAIDASATAAWNGGAGFVPLGTESSPFTGTLDGNGYSISNLNINAPSGTDVGLFGAIGSNAVIQNVRLTSASVKGYDNVGVLAGLNQGSIAQSGATGTATGSVIASGGPASANTGGLVGNNLGQISDSGSVVQVQSSASVGGLVGLNFGTIQRSSAGGPVFGANDFVGGLVGGNLGSIDQSFATGSVTGEVYSTGGLVGANGDSGHVNDSYARGTVTNTVWFNTGGLIGDNTGAVGTSYATGLVSGCCAVGGLIGRTERAGTASSSYWDVDSTGIAKSDGGTAIANAQLTSGSLPGGFSSSVWTATSGQPPTLQWQSAQSQTVNFFDDFNRADGLVGNGWSETSDAVNGNLIIRNGVVTSQGVDGLSDLNRPIDLSAPVTVTATVTPTSGFGGLLDRFGTYINFGNDGTLNSGYGVLIYRGDQTFNNSTVFLEQNGIVLAAAPSSFQFDVKVIPTVTFSPDGSISGAISGSGQIFDFSFGPRSVSLPGSNLEIVQALPNSRALSYTFPTLDNVAITGPKTEDVLQRFVSAIKPAYALITDFGISLEALGFSASALASLGPLLAVSPELVVALLALEPELVGLGEELHNGFDLPDPPATLPKIVPDEIVTPQIADELNNVLQNSLVLNSDAAGLLADMQNIRIALDSNDQNRARLLEDSFMQLDGSFVQTSSFQEELYRDIAENLRAQGLADLVASAEDFSDYRGLLESDGFPASEILIFDALGFSGAQIDGIRSDLLGLDLNGAPNSLYSFLDKGSQISSAISRVPESPPLPLFAAGFVIVIISRRMERRR